MSSKGKDKSQRRKSKTWENNKRRKSKTSSDRGKTPRAARSSAATTVSTISETPAKEKEVKHEVKHAKFQPGSSLPKHESEVGDVQLLASHGRENDFTAPVPFVTLPIDSEAILAKTTDSRATIFKTAYGLDILDKIERVFIHQHHGKFHFNTDMTLNRRYIIMDPAGQTILLAGECVDCGSRCWRGMQRRYCIYFFSVSGEILYTIERQRLKCCSRHAPVQEAVAANLPNVTELNLADSSCHLANGEFIGQLRDASRACTPNYHIDDETYTNIIGIKGKTGSNLCPLCACNSNKFEFFDRQHNLMGAVENNVLLEPRKNKTTPNDTKSSKPKKCFTANFPIHLSHIQKSLIIAAVFDLNISYFERRWSWDCCVYVSLCLWILSFLGASIFLLLWATSVI